MSAPAIMAGDLATARALKARAVAALGALTIGEVTDMLADRRPWQLIYCHAIAHALAPTERCARPCCIQPGNLSSSLLDVLP